MLYEDIFGLYVDNDFLGLLEVVLFIICDNLYFLYIFVEKLFR